MIHQVADALNYAHGEGVVHRDVKPANVMVDRRGNLVVMDFGIAKAIDEANLTRTGLVIGTPAYMSPEQCLAQRVTSAADQYSLGTVAYELLTGRTPFRGSALEMQWAHTRETPEPIASLRPDCPPELETLVLRMLAKQPADRWPSLQDVVDALPLAPGAELAARQYLAGARDDRARRGRAGVALDTGQPDRASPARDRRGPDDERAAVVPTPVSSLRVTPLTLTLAPRKKARVSAVALDDAGNELAGRTMIWTARDPAVATVDSGRIQGVGPGSADVEVACEGVAVTVSVTVSALVTRGARANRDRSESRRSRVWPVATVAVISLLAALGVVLRHPWRDDTQRVSSVAPRPSPSNDSAATRLAQPAAPLPAPVSDKGPAAGPANGPRTPAPTRSPSVGASSPAAPGTLGVVALGVSPASALPDLAPGDSSRIVVHALDADSRDVPPDRIKWRSSAAGVASVSATGWVKAIAPGQTEILISADTMRRSVSVRVVLPRAARVEADQTPRRRADSAAATRRHSERLGAHHQRRVAIPWNPRRCLCLHRRMADTLFNALAAIINARALARVTADAGTSAEARLQQDFVTFLRQAQPLASVQRVHVGAVGASGVEVTAAMHFTWRNQAGGPFDRIARFSGLAVYTNGGWALRNVRLLNRFW